MVDKTKNFAKWIGFVIAFIAIFGIVSFPLNAYLTANCLHTQPKYDPEFSHAEKVPNLNNYADLQQLNNSKTEGKPDDQKGKNLPEEDQQVSGRLEIPTISITEAEIHHPNVSLKANPEETLSGSTASSDVAMVNVSETDKAHTGIEFEITNFISSLSSDKNPISKRRIFEALSAIAKEIVKERDQHVYSRLNPVQQTLSGLKESSDIAKQEAETISPIPIEADSRIELKISNYIWSIVSDQSDPIAKRKIFDALSAIVRQERDHQVSLKPDAVKTLSLSSDIAINLNQRDREKRALVKPSVKPSNIFSTPDLNEKKYDEFCIIGQWILFFFGILIFVLCIALIILVLLKIRRRFPNTEVMFNVC